MTHIKVKGFKIFRDKKPPFAERCYHRTTGHKIDLEKAQFGSAAFFAECGKIRAIAEGMKAGAPKAGTLGRIIATYYAEDHFKNLSYQRPSQLTSAQTREVMEAMAFGSLAKKFHALQQASTMSS